MKERIAALNDRQQEAVTHPGGPLLVLAGAGSGKTRVLTLRLAWLVEVLGLAPWQLLAVTFTNKAAAEMRERVSANLAPGSGDPWVSTFHSSCLRMLRRDIELLPGYTRDFVIYDDRDSKEMVRRLVKEAKLPKTVNPRAISAAIDRAKNDGLSPEALTKSKRPGLDPHAPDIYRLYQERLKNSNALDFGDLILKTVELLEANPQVLEGYRKRFSHILVDEYQDTNHAQYRLLRLLADHSDRNITVVGDEDQSIYSFRGADIRNILDFERDFEGAKTVRLERNYRSSATILKAATAVVERNAERLGKTLWTDRGEGEPIRVELSWDDREEARCAAEIVAKELRSGRPARDIALFYRTNAQSRLIEEEFLSARLPFVLVGGQRFYERKEVKDAMSYLRLLHNPDDEASLLRVINTPARGIGQKTVAAIATRAARLGGSMGAALDDLVQTEELPKRALSAVRAFRDLICDLRSLAQQLPLPRVLEAVYEQTNLVAKLTEQGTFEAEQRVANLQELLASTLEWAQAEPPDGLKGFLDRVSLVADTDRLEDGDGGEGKVTLMTVHSAKGLEFPVVLVIGMDEGSFPHSRASSFQSELEEERRLAYVAITRAMERLYVLRARRRPARGGQGYEATQPSRFLRDIPNELMTGAVPAPRLSRRSPAPALQGTRTHRHDPRVEYDDDIPEFPSRFAGRKPQVREAATSSNEPEEPPNVERHWVPDPSEVVLGVGTRVRHPRFGEGEVRSLEGPPDNLRATVFFRQQGPKKLYLRYANLELLSC